MSLADELLADLEDDEEEESMETEELADLANAKSTEITENYSMKQKTTNISSSVKDVARLYHSDRLKDVLERIKEFSGKARKAEELQGPVEADPEYLLIVDANNLAAEIDDEIINLHKLAKDKYSKRFPELETLVVQPLDYLLTAKELRNNLDQAKNNPVLEKFLSQATIMVISVTASTTQGVNLGNVDLEPVTEAADTAVSLNKAKIDVLAYVESRMAFIAPNLSKIVGASTAAKVMGVAGGLTALSKMPSNNIALLGQQKKTLSGFSQHSTLPHTGFIYYSNIVQDLPPDIRRKASRLVASKCALAARVDSFHEYLDGTQGDFYLEEIEKKIDKLKEPPETKASKALPAPLEGPKKKRGGRRVRKLKERFAVTELRKQANRMNFGEIEEDVYQNDLGYSRGNIGKGGTGSIGIRMAQIDERTKVRASQTLKRSLQKEQATFGGATTIKKHVSGTASSVAFTPLQGLEIVNPLAAEKRVDEANAKYFSPSAAFHKIKTPLPQ